MQVFVIKVVTSALVCGILVNLGILTLFDYGDFNHYARRLGFISPNFLYSIVIRSMSLETIAHPVLVISAIIGSVCVDVLCILLLIQYACNRKFLFLGYCLFCFHPYFAVYTFRLDTLFFSKLACIMFILHVSNSELFKLRYSSVVIAFLVCFRLSAIIFLFGIFINRLIDIRFKIFNLKAAIIIMVLITYTAAVLYMNGNYTSQVYYGSKDYGWDTSYSVSIFGNFGYLVDTLLLFMLKILVLFGGREALFTNGLNYFTSDWVGVIQLVIFLILAIFHLFCLIKFISFTSLNKKVFITCLSLFPLILCIFTVFHMRYLLTYYPMILLGFLWFINPKQKA